MNELKQALPDMSKTQKARIIAALCICLTLNVIAILCVYEIFNYQPMEKPADKYIYVDGEDFSPFADMAAAGLNGAMYMLTCTMSVVAIFVFGIIMLVPFLLIALRKTAIVPDIEVQYAKKLIGIMALLTFVICLIVSHFSQISIDIVFASLPMLLMLLFYYLPVRLKMKNNAAF